MKNLFLILLMSFSVLAGLNVMERKQEEKVRGFILQQKLKPPEELFKDIQPLKESRTEPIPESNSYVSFEKYMNDMIEMNSKIVALEMKLKRLIKLTESIQASTINNKSFILKIVEILFGSGGLLATIILLRGKARKINNE